MTDLELLREFCERFSFDYIEEKLDNDNVYVNMTGDEFIFDEDGNCID